jgi:hypothetical protein
MAWSWTRPQLALAPSDASGSSRWYPRRLKAGQQRYLNWKYEPTHTCASVPYQLRPPSLSWFSRHRRWPRRLRKLAIQSRLLMNLIHNTSSLLRSCFRTHDVRCLLCVLEYGPCRYQELFLSTELRRPLVPSLRQPCRPRTQASHHLLQRGTLFERQ